MISTIFRVASRYILVCPTICLYTLRHQDMHNIVQLSFPQMRVIISTSWLQVAVLQISYIGLDFSNPSPHHSVAWILI
jgi:hypothetical protein